MAPDETFPFSDSIFLTINITIVSNRVKILHFLLVLSSYKVNSIFFKIYLYVPHFYGAFWVCVFTLSDVSCSLLDLRYILRLRETHCDSSVDSEDSEWESLWMWVIRQQPSLTLLRKCSGSKCGPLMSQGSRDCGCSSAFPSSFNP